MKINKESILSEQAISNPIDADELKLKLRNQRLKSAIWFVCSIVIVLVAGRIASRFLGITLDSSASLSMIPIFVFGLLAGLTQILTRPSSYYSFLTVQVGLKKNETVRKEFERLYGELKKAEMVVNFFLPALCVLALGAFLTDQDYPNSVFVPWAGLALSLPFIVQSVKENQRLDSYTIETISKLESSEIDEIFGCIKEMPGETEDDKEAREVLLSEIFYWSNNW